MDEDAFVGVKKKIAVFFLALADFELILPPCGGHGIELILDDPNGIKNAGKRVVWVNPVAIGVKSLLFPVNTADKQKQFIYISLDQAVLLFVPGWRRRFFFLLILTDGFKRLVDIPGDHNGKRRKGFGHFYGGRNQCIGTEDHIHTERDVAMPVKHVFHKQLPASAAEPPNPRSIHNDIVKRPLLFYSVMEFIEAGDMFGPELAFRHGKQDVSIDNNALAAVIRGLELPLRAHDEFHGIEGFVAI